MKPSFKTNQLKAILFAALTTAVFACTPDPEIQETAETDTNQGSLSPEMDTADYNRLMTQVWGAMGSDKLPDAFVKKYQLTYSPMVTANIGGAVYSGTTSAWSGGTASGSGYLSPALFAALNASVSRKIQLEVINKPLLCLKPARITFLDKGGYSVDGLYNTCTQEFLFLHVLTAGGGAVGDGSCGYVTLASFYGVLNAEGTAISNGQYSAGFITGCSVPFIFAGSVTFHYTGAATL